ncbi:MAG: hypothetical protein NUV69_03355 [Candidatus Curtissbacteria bacterium]|nr:hypothetical protein [Candidatus Curtissbacteria bacterium]
MLTMRAEVNTEGAAQEQVRAQERLRLALEVESVANGIGAFILQPTQDNHDKLLESIEELPPTLKSYLDVSTPSEPTS